MTPKSFLKYCYYRFIQRDVHMASYTAWRDYDGDTNLRYDYVLGLDSLVIDAGGYRGDFAAEIHKRSGCFVIVFEPVPEYFEAIGRRFHDMVGVEVVPAGLSDRNEVCQLTVSGSSSSTYASRSDDASTVAVNMVSIDDFLVQRGIGRVDLLKLNIEGGEFVVLDSLVRTGQIEKIVNLQVQFHAFVEDAEAKRALLRRQLAQTHRLVWDYPFVWESWALKS